MKRFNGLKLFSSVDTREPGGVQNFGGAFNEGGQLCLASMWGVERESSISVLSGGSKMGIFDKIFKPTAPKPPVINPANGMPMHGGIGGFDGKGNLYGQDKSPFPKPNFPKQNPFPKNKF